MPLQSLSWASGTLACKAIASVGVHPLSEHLRSIKCLPRSRTTDERHDGRRPTDVDFYRSHVRRVCVRWRSWPCEAASVGGLFDYAGSACSLKSSVAMFIRKSRVSRSLTVRTQLSLGLREDSTSRTSRSASCHAASSDRSCTSSVNSLESWMENLNVRIWPATLKERRRS
jgi:hypothetical protein